MPSGSSVEARTVMNSSPFLRLPPELRDMIYHELLVDPVKEFDWRTPVQTPFYPGILSTCRIIHEEASNILYGRNAVHFHVGTEFFGFYFYGRRFDFRGLVGFMSINYLPLRKVKHLEVWVDSRAAYTNEPVWLRHWIRKLSSWLARGHSLQSLDIRLSSSENPRMSTSSLDETVLEQFTILRGIEEVSIRGAVTEDYAQRLKNIIRDSAPVVDLWEQYNLLLRWHLASRKILQTRFQDSREGKEPGFLDHFNRTKSIAPDIDAAKVAMMCGDVEGFMRAKEVVVERLQCDYAEVMKHIRTIDATRTMLMGLRGKKEE